MCRFLFKLIFVLLIFSAGQKNADAKNIAYVTSAETDTVVVISFEKKGPVFIKSIPVGKRPRGIAITPDQSRAYVTNTYDGTLSIIDLSTNTVIGKPIPVNSVPWAIAINSDGTKAYVTSFSDGSVSVLDLKNHQLIGSPLAVGVSPFAIVTCRRSDKAYVLNMGNGTISLIDTKSNEVKKTIRVGSHPRSVILTADEKKAYITCNKEDAVYVLDVEKDEIIGSPIPVGKHPTSMGMNRDGSKIFVINKEDGTVSVISTTKDLVEKTIPVKGHPSLIGVSDSENELHLLGDLRGELQMIDLSTLTSNQQTLNLPFSPKAIAYKSSSSSGYIREFFSRMHFLLSSMLEDKNPETNTGNITLTTSNQSKAHLKGLALSAGSQFLAITDIKSDVAYLYNLQKNKYEDIVYKVGKNPKEVMFSPTGNMLLTVNPDGDNVSFVDFSHNIPRTATLDVAPRPRSFAMTSDERYLLVVNSRISQLQIIDLKDSAHSKKQLKIGSTLWAVAINPKKMDAYITDWAEGVVHVISLNNKEKLAKVSIKVGKNPRAIVVNSQGTRAYVTNWGDASLSVIDLEKNIPQVIKTIPVGKHPRAIALNEDSQTAYVVNANDGTISIINTNTYSAICTLHVEKYPVGIAISKETNKAYITHRGKSFISVVDLKTNKVEYTINDCPPQIF